MSYITYINLNIAKAILTRLFDDLLLDLIYYQTLINLNCNISIKNQLLIIIKLVIAIYYFQKFLSIPSNT